MLTKQKSLFFFEFKPNGLLPIIVECIWLNEGGGKSQLIIA